MMSPIQLFPNSFHAASREVQKNGVTWLVVPGIPIREMVLNYYLVPGEEISHFTGAWNGIPVTIHHPRQNNGAANVPDPDVPVIGRLYGSTWDDDEKRLQGEYWINVSEAEKTLEGQAILDRIRAGKQIETSTGYYADEEEAEGIFGDKRYTAIHRNLRPEHLAILPNEIGACSLKDGCGVNRNDQHVTVNCAGCPCKGGQAASLDTSLPASEPGDLPAVQAEALPLPTLNEENVMPQKLNFVMDLLSRLGVTVNDASALQVEEAPDDQPVSPVVPETVPPTPAPATPPVPATQNHQVLGLNADELAAIRGWINLTTEFGGPEGFKRIVAAMQEVSQVQQNASREQKNRAIETLVTNSRCPFGREELDAMPTDQVLKLHQAFAPVNYAGLGLDPVHANAQEAGATPKPVLLAKRQPAQADK